MTVFHRMRYRIPAATLPYNSRKDPRIQVRIPFLNRKNDERFFWIRTTCAMVLKKCLAQGFLLALGVWSL